MGLLPYAVSDVLRNRRRTVSAILGVFLAVTFVAGTFIAIDSSARGILDASLAGIPGDFTASVNVYNENFNYTVLRDSLADLAGIEEVSVWRSLPISNLATETGGDPLRNMTYVNMIAIDPEHLPVSLRNAEITGSLDLPAGTVALDRDLAEWLGVGMGDRVVAFSEYIDPEGNPARHEASLTITALLRLDYSQFGFRDVIIVPPFSTAAVHLGHANELLAQLNQTQIFYSLSAEIWIDRTAYVNPYDLAATERNLARLERRIQAVLGPANWVSNNILSRIQFFQQQITSLRFQYLFLSLPVIFVGVYLGAVGVDLSHAERRRELAVLRTRGASRAQVMGLLLVEAIVGGLIAAVLGLVAGVGLSRLLANVIHPSGSPSVAPPFVLTVDTILIMALLSMFLMAAVAYRSAKRTASLPIVETLRYYAKGETRIAYSPKVDIALVTIGVVDYSLVWFLQSNPTMTLWIIVLSVVAFALFPVVPFLLVIGVTRIATRSTARVYDSFARVSRVFTKDLYYVIRRNLQRNPRRSANIAIIIALGLAFGVFTLTVIGSQLAYQERIVRAQIGADMAAVPLDPFDTTFATNLSRIPGVAGVTPIVRLYPDASTYCCPAVYAINPAAYFAVAQPERWYLRDASWEEASGVMKTPGQVLISQEFYRRSFLEIGDVIRLSMSKVDPSGNYLGTVYANVTVGGIVRLLPGAGYGALEEAIYGSPQTFQGFIEVQSTAPFRSSDKYLVDLAPSADWRAAKAQVLELTPNVQVTQEEIERERQNPFFRAFQGFIGLEIAFIVVILTMGLGLILYAASLERDVEFAGIMARGASGWQAATILVGEAFVITLVGLVVGASAGLGTAYFTMQLLFVGLGAQTAMAPFYFVFPGDAVLLVILAPAAMLLSALLVSLKIARMNVAHILKLRGG